MREDQKTTLCKMYMRKKQTRTWSKTEGMSNESGISIVKLRAARKLPPETESLEDGHGGQSRNRGRRDTNAQAGHMQTVVVEGFGGRLEGRGREGGSTRTRVVAAGASSPRGVEANVEDGAEAGMPRHPCTSRGCAQAHHRCEFLCFCVVFVCFAFCVFFLLSCFHCYFYFIFIYVLFLLNFFVELLLILFFFLSFFKLLISIISFFVTHSGAGDGGDMTEYLHRVSLFFKSHSV